MGNRTTSDALIMFTLVPTFTPDETIHVYSALNNIGGLQFCYLRMTCATCSAVIQVISRHSSLVEPLRTTVLDILAFIFRSRKSGNVFAEIFRSFDVWASHFALKSWFTRQAVSTWMRLLLYWLTKLNASRRKTVWIFICTFRGYDVGSLWVRIGIAY